MSWMRWGAVTAPGRESPVLGIVGEFSEVESGMQRAVDALPVRAQHYGTIEELRMLPGWLSTLEPSDTLTFVVVVERNLLEGTARGEVISLLARQHSALARTGVGVVTGWVRSRSYTSRPWLSAELTAIEAVARTVNAASVGRPAPAASILALRQQEIWWFPESSERLVVRREVDDEEVEVEIEVRTAHVTWFRRDRTWELESLSVVVVDPIDGADRYVDCTLDAVPPRNTPHPPAWVREAVTRRAEELNPRT